MKEKFHENEYVTGWVEDGIMFARFKVPTIEIETAKTCVVLRKEASQGLSYPVLIDARSVSNISKAARDYLASDEGTHLVVASALVIDSVVGKFLGNFFLQISKPKVPLRLFTTEQEAIKWLQQFKSKEPMPQAAGQGLGA